MTNQYNILELMLNHEIQLHEAIAKEEYKVAAKIIYAMSQLIPKTSTPTFICKTHNRILSDDKMCRDHGRIMNEDEYTISDEGSF